MANLSIRDEIYNQYLSFVNENLPAFAKKYFDSLDNAGKSPRTLLQYAYDINSFLNYLKSQPSYKNVNFNAAKASDILDPLTYDDLNEYITYIGRYEIKGKSHKSSAAYKARKLASLRSFYNHFYKVGEIKRNTAALVDIPKIIPKEKDALDKEQSERLMDTIINCPTKTAKQRWCRTRDAAMFALLLSTGMRVSELVGIDLSDIDKKTNSVKIIRKGGHEDRVYYGDFAKEKLQEWLLLRSEYVKNDDLYPFLFVSNKLTRIDTRSVERILEKYTLLAGINKKITPHILRKTYGTYLYKNTGDIYLVCKTLGHSSVETTARHYIKDDEDKKMAAKFSILDK